MARSSTQQRAEQDAAAGQAEIDASADEFPSVFGKYVLVRPLARGGMGELFLSVAGETGGFEKLCVVKKVLRTLGDAAVHRRFLDEAKVVVRLNHSNLVQVFDAGRVDSEHYLAMELVEGKDLRAVWNRCAQLHRRIPVDIAIFVIREVLRGLDYVHDAMSIDLVHRDISPPNLLVGYRGEVKLTDFGLAKSAIKREMTSPGVVFGRYSYLSPEQARGLEADRRTDIYACAIVLWELLTGRQLFPSGGRSHQEALDAVRNPEPKAPSSLVPGIPRGLDDVVLNGLARDPDERYAKADEFRVALSEILAREFATCDADRVAEFMRDIFARESKMEAREFQHIAQHDYSSLRERAEKSELVSISEVLKRGDLGRSTIELGDSDIVELDKPGPRWDEKPNAASLKEAATALVGRVISQRYRVDRLLGIGGMGAVFGVTHLALGKTFALKVLHSVYTRDSDIIARFMREARAATQTGHPNIIDVLDIGTTDEGDVFFVMELLGGVNLGRTVHAEGPIAVRRAVHIARQICRALAAAHAAGIIHRDLKSENVVLCLRGKDPDFVKVLDFGICKHMNADSTTTSPGLIMGSPDYMAPEQGAGLDATVTSDVYAVGCVLFEALTGVLPFQGRNAVDVLMQKGAREARRVTELRSEVPESLADVIARCLRRNPTERPLSMRSLEYELTRAVDGRATAVAAVLGITSEQDSRDEASAPGASASMSMNQAVVDGVAPGYTRQENTEIAARPLHHGLESTSHPSVPVAPSALPRVLKAAFFTGLGGALALAVLAVAVPGSVSRIFSGGPGPDAAGPDELGTQEPRAAAVRDVDGQLYNPEPDPGPDPGSDAVVPTPIPDTPAPSPAVQDPSSDAKGTGTAQPVAPIPAVARAAPTAAELAVAAQSALAAQRWREPPETSMGLALSRLALLDPGHEAISRLRQAAAEILAPKAAKALKRKRWREAADGYRDLKAVWPEHTEARTALAQALLGQGRVLVRAKDYAGALTSADELLNTNGDSYRANMLRGDALYGLRRYAEAKESYRAARKQRPRSKTAREKFFKAARKTRRSG